MDRKITLFLFPGWAHVVCALYIPEVQFANVSTMEPIVLQSVPHDRYNKVQCLVFSCSQNIHLLLSKLGSLKKLFWYLFYHIIGLFKIQKGVRAIAQGFYLHAAHLSLIVPPHPPILNDFLTQSGGTSEQRGRSPVVHHRVWLQTERQKNSEGR